MASAALASVPQAAKSVVAAAARRTGRTATGVVVSAGLAEKTAKVRVGGEIWNQKVKKYFKSPEKHLVHDPNNSLRTGDVVEIVSGWRTSKMKRFVVNRIIAPFGPPIEERPPVPTPEEREATHALRTKMKKERKYLREQAERLQQRLARAEKVTGEITKMALNMKLVRDVEWTATPSQSK
ncbi:hypothetical protein N0V93_008602 [Gnomoniopsis smithogilvyi]|uniref:30S ribosomal protein S17 n=1 Tax=Gnomoniopsis smithogilvyi TaxID=1191159 RepID=A0A9W8YM08_9PEZI|nr:hypothetical protein N0V93_008602 [Gnomoniopsis smithogilvyi]